MWTWLAKLGLAALGFVTSLLTGRSNTQQQNAGRNAQKVDDATKLNQEVTDAKTVDNAVTKSSDAANAAELRRDWSRDAPEL